MQNNLAPIGISTYSRLQLLKKTIEALQKNVLAEHSELFVFSDAPRSGDEKQVEAVRSYLRTITGFKEIHIFERKKNNRTANNRRGIRMLLNRFGKAIFLEEDIVTAPGFLTFMNQALNNYESNDRIFSVVGFCPPIKIPADYKHDVFFLRRFSGWGLGIWKNRFDHIKYITADEYEQFAANKQRVREFVKGGGEDMMVMLKADAYGEIDAGDVKAMYAQFISNQYTVYPTQSLVQNNGCDGTGTHCIKTDRFNVILSNKTTFHFSDKIVPDSRIIKENLIFRGGPLDESIWERMTNRFGAVLSEAGKVIKQLSTEKASL
jgi:hypothetical protein